MSTARPLFFSDLVPFDTQAHRQLRLPAQRDNFAYAAKANLVPLTFAEVAQALHHYPVVFVAEGASQTPALVALLSLAPGSNRFVDAQGHWRAGSYVPAYVRGYPFLAVRAADKAEPVLAFDPNAAVFKAAGGQPLLDGDGKPSVALKAIMAFHAEYQQLATATRDMVQALKDAGVLEEGNLQIQLPQQEARKINGFLIVSEAKLKALPAPVLKKLADANALGLAYAQIFSMGKLSALLSPAPAPQAAPAAASRH